MSPLDQLRLVYACIPDVFDRAAGTPLSLHGKNDATLVKINKHEDGGLFAECEFLNGERTNVDIDVLLDEDVEEIIRTIKIK